MEQTNGTGPRFASPMMTHYIPDASGRNDVSNSNNSTSGAVFPGFQNYTNLYPQCNDNNEPVNLSNTRSETQIPPTQTVPYSKHGSTLSKRGQKRPPVVTSHAPSMQQIQHESFSHNSLPSHVQSRVSAVGNQPSSNIMHQISADVMSQQVFLPELSPISQTSSAQLASAYSRQIYSQNPALSQSLKSQIRPGDLSQYQMLPKPRQRRPRGSKTAGTPRLPSSAPRPKMESPMKHEGGISSFTSDPNSPISAKVPIQPLKRPPPTSLPVKKQSKSKPILANTYKLILPLPTSGSSNSPSTTTLASHLASSSPAIQAALNQPVLERKLGGKKLSQLGDTVNSSNLTHHIPALQQAPTMMHYLSQPPLQTAPVPFLGAKPVKPGRRKSNKHRDGIPTPFQLVKRSKPGFGEERFVMAPQISGIPLTGGIVHTASTFMPDQFAIVSSPRSAMMNSQPTSNDNLLMVPGKPNGTVKESAATRAVPIEADKFAPVDLRRYNDDFAPVPAMLDLPEGPRSLLELRQYHKRKGMQLSNSLVPDSENNSEPNVRADDTPAPQSAFHQQLATAKPQASASTAAVPGSPPDFDWISYLRSTGSKASPQTAFKHLEASLVNGFQIGMKVETPLRGTDTDKYWLATVVAVYGGVLKLRFDGYGDRSHDFTVACSSGQLHPIGWCSKNQKSLLPPADIRHTQKQWKNFLLNVLQGAKTIPTYLLNSHGCPWIADRIKQGMRLEVQHENLPSAVWVAKVIRNVGGRMMLRYEGSIDDATDFWLFYLDRRAHPCGWSVTPNNKHIIYKPPDEIKESFEYDAWSNILQEVTRDSNIDRIPTEIFQVYPELPANTFQVGQLLEAVHPSGTYIGPVRISSVINQRYFLIEYIDSNGVQGASRCYFSQEPTLLPVGWCATNQVTLGKPPGTSNNEAGSEFSWAEYMSQTSALPCAASDFCNQIPTHQFSVGQKVEAVNPPNPSQICVATITRIVERLMWLDIYTTPHISTTIIVDVASQSIFPSGWCESNSYPLTAPLVIPQPEQFSPSNGAASQHGELGPKIYFNQSCFSGPFLSKSRLLELPESVGPGHIRLIAKEMLSLVLSVGYKSSYILKILQRTTSTSTNLQTQIIKTKCKGKNYEGAVEVCTKRSELKSYCRQICKRLQCCPNLVSPEKIAGRCSERCETMTKTQYLYMGSRKPGRPSNTHPDGSKKKKRRRRKKVFTPRRNLYIPNHEYRGALSENGSGSSNYEEDRYSPLVDAAVPHPATVSRHSPSVKCSPTPRSRLPSTPSSRPSSAADDRRGNLPKDHPLYQLQLTSVKKEDAPVTNTAEPEEAHQYQIVKEKKKRGRPSKFISPEALKRTTSLPISPSKRYPTVPPLKIRRLELSPTMSASADDLLDSSNASNKFELTENHSMMAVSSSSQAGSLPFTVSNGSVYSSIANSIQTQANANSGSGLLLKAAVPHRMAKSALSYTQPRLHIDDMERVVLTDNPIYWDVTRIQSFIEQTDCASLTDKLSDHGVDGQAFMMLVLPTVQEELGLKLGPALKLCHHVQRLKLAFYETFHPEA